MAKLFDSCDPLDYINGAVIISDSKDIPILITDINGLNGSIGFLFESYERHLTIEFRSPSALNTMYSNIFTGNGVINFNDGSYTRDYLVRSLIPSGYFDSVPPVWTFEIVLYRDNNTETI
jgi:hypothetical protein